MYYRGIEIKATVGLHEKALEVIKDLPGKVILDVASGPGAMSQRLIDSGFEVSAIDRLSSDEIQCKGLESYYKLDLNQDDWWTGIDHPNFADIVMSLETIEHLENPRSFFRNLKKMCKPGGYIVLSTPNIESPLSKAWFLFRDRFSYFGDSDYELSGHITPILEFQIRNICKEIDGLTLEKVHLIKKTPYFVKDGSLKGLFFSLFANIVFGLFGERSECKIYQIKVRSDYNGLYNTNLEQ
jgi:SAM-dependent methyltransferase